MRFWHVWFKLVKNFLNLFDSLHSEQTIQNSANKFKKNLLLATFLFIQQLALFSKLVSSKEARLWRIRFELVKLLLNLIWIAAFAYSSKQTQKLRFFFLAVLSSSTSAQMTREQQRDGIVTQSRRTCQALFARRRTLIQQPAALDRRSPIRACRSFRISSSHLFCASSY